MVPGYVPIFLIHKILTAGKVELIHSEYDRLILWPPLFLIGIAICHAHFLHHTAASWIVPVVCGRNIGKAILLYLFYDCFSRFRSDSPMPEFSAKSIPKVMAFLYTHMDITYWKIVFPQTDGVIIALRKPVF